MISSIKFFYNGLRLNGSRSLVRVGYSLDLDAQTVTIYARSGETLPRELFTVENDTDLYTDYFDDDSTTLTPAHPLYKFAAYAAARADLRRLNSRADYLRGRISTPNTWDAMHPDALTAELEGIDARRAALESIPNPGQPTAADLAAVDQMNQDAENAARAAAQAEQQRRREEALAESANTRAIVREEIAAHPLDMNAPAGIISVTFAPELLDALRREYPAQAGQSIPAEHPAGADIPAQAPAGDTGNCAGRNNPRTIPARGAWVPSVVSSAHPASNPAEHPAQGDEPAAREEVEQLRDALRSLSDVELAACLFHVDPASSDARPMSAVFLREMSRRDPVRSFATFKAWRAGDIPPDVRALLDSLADGDPDAGGD